jgi:hypothetical protein
MAAACQSLSAALLLPAQSTAQALCCLLPSAPPSGAADNLINANVMSLQRESPLFHTRTCSTAQPQPNRRCCRFAPPSAQARASWQAYD